MGARLEPKSLARTGSARGEPGRRRPEMMSVRRASVTSRAMFRRARGAGVAEAALVLGRLAMDRSGMTIPTLNCRQFSASEKLSTVSAQRGLGRGGVGFAGSPQPPQFDARLKVAFP